ncbi:MAG: WGR domain-containing protein [Rhodobacterales bacterium]|nr:WGR domain-containing protein [Rhodobacterales bacterium]
MKAKSVQIVYMRHEGGTKDYHFIVLDDHVSGQSVLHTRWGKIGAGGQMGSSPTHADNRSIKNLLKKQMDARMKRGYEAISTTTYEHVTELALDDADGMRSISNNTALSRMIDDFMLTNSDMTVDAGVEKAEPEASAPEPDRGVLWGSW